MLSWFQVSRLYSMLPESRLVDSGKMTVALLHVRSITFAPSWSMGIAMRFQFTHDIPIPVECHR